MAMHAGDRRRADGAHADEQDAKFSFAFSIFCGFFTTGDYII